MVCFEIVGARKLTWDVIPLSWRIFLKFSLEMASISFAVGPLMVFLGTNSFAGFLAFANSSSTVSFLDEVMLSYLDCL